MNIYQPKRSRDAQATMSVRLTVPEVRALRTYAKQSHLTQGRLIAGALRTNDKYRALLALEQEAYAKELNRQNRKVDIFVSQVHQDIEGA